MSEQTSNIKVLAGCILLTSDSYDWDMMKLQLFDDWRLEIEEEPSEDAFIIKINGVTIACSFVHTPKEGAVEGAGNNLEWEGAVEAVQAHCAHIEMGVLDAENPLQRSILFTMVASSMLAQQNAIGIYQYPVVRRAGAYMESAQMLRQDSFPVLNWVYIGIFQKEGGTLGAYTYGLAEFGKEEIEIVDTKASAFTLYQFLYNLVNYVISNDDTLKDGETIGMTQDQAFTITRSEGVVLPGTTTVKIDF
jgi:hypothetical protein